MKLPMRRSIATRLALCLTCLFVCWSSAQSAHAADAPLRAADLDAAVYAEWVGGTETAITPADAKDNDRRPEWITWTDQPARGHSGMVFGASNAAGPRHLRVGFTRAIAVGGLMVRGGGRVSVLKPDAAYPGNLADDAQWIPAERVVSGAVGAAEAGREDYALWTLPAVVNTRAVRFTRDAQVTDKDYSGWVGGVYLFPTRVTNLAPQSTPAVGRNSKAAPKLVNDDHDGWDQWCNVPLKGEDPIGARPTLVSSADPEWVMLVWPKPVTLSGLAALFAGFKSADAQAFTGPADMHPREAPESAWQTVASYTDLKNRYPAPLGVDMLEFPRPVTTRAVRLRITASEIKPGHPHVANRTLQGKRVWLGELMALSPVEGAAPLASTILPKDAGGEQPPIAIKFTLPEPGWVTLVMEDSTGKRVRNLIAETYFPKGDNSAYWDGSDDLGRDKDAAEHGLYLIPTQFVQPGKYRVRGLWRKQVDVSYEFGVYDAGRTPWETTDKTGGWLANHSPPSAALFVPDAITRDGKTRPTMLLGSYVSEGTAGLAWVDAATGEKYRGQNWVGGNWTGAPFLARDAGAKRVAGTYAYVGAAWAVGEGKKPPFVGEIRVTALTGGEDKPVVRYQFTPAGATEKDRPKWTQYIGGMAAHDGKVVVSLPPMNRLIVVDVAAGKVVREVETAKPPRGLSFDADGGLLVLAGDELARYAPAAVESGGMPKLIARGLDEPTGLAVGPNGEIYVSERGHSHQVKVFVADGKPLRTIGKPGVPKMGAHDPLHLNNPRGMTVDPQGRLWVAEEDNQPKRVSVWNADGSLARAFYGPTEYGGGGAIDPQDKTRYYYNGMEFRLDWEKGTDEVSSVFYRVGGHEEEEDENAEPAKDAHGPGKQLKLPFRAGVPQNAMYHEGKRFWNNAFNSSPTGGHGSAFLFREEGGVAIPCAGAGRANQWPLLLTPEFASRWPEGTDPKANPHASKVAFFLWSDVNADGYPQPDEVEVRKGSSGGVTITSDFSIVVSRLDEFAVQFRPTWTEHGGKVMRPVYEMAKPAALVRDPNGPASSGGDQVLLGPDGWSIHTNAPKPFSAAGIGGAKNGVPLWSYPSLWPGLHASHEAPIPDRPGMIVGHTRLLGDVITPGANGGESMFLLNSNHGVVYAFTTDGLYVTTLFREMRVAPGLRMSQTQRGMPCTNLTLGEENFWPSVARTNDGKVYLLSGGSSAVLRVDGLDTVKRIAPFDVEVKTDDLNRAADYFARAEAARQAAQGRGAITVPILKQVPTVDGKLDEWSHADWAEVDKRGTAANFNSDSRPYDVTGALAFAGDRLYASWRTGNKDLLKNAGDVPTAPFKTGGCLDLMIAADPSADPKRTKPVAGDQRLLITCVGGKTKALLYRAVDPANAKQPVPFASPWRTITFDSVTDVSDQVQLAADAEGNYEVSVPLATLGLKSAAGLLRGDIGVLRGDGATTTQRVYWSNKSTAIISDVPSEAELRPALWGRWEVKEEK